MKDYAMLLRTDFIFYLLRKNIKLKDDLLYVQEQSNNYILENRMNLRWSNLWNIWKNYPTYFKCPWPRINIYLTYLIINRNNDNCN